MENFNKFYILVKDLGSKPKRCIVKASNILNKCIKIRVGHFNLLTELKFEIEHD
jgi:mRNA-degrading endonuclease RelE of RelBE toxin-antitoxin system